MVRLSGGLGAVEGGGHQPRGDEAAAAQPPGEVWAVEVRTGGQWRLLTAALPHYPHHPGEGVLLILLVQQLRHLGPLADFVHIESSNYVKLDSSRCSLFLILKEAFFWVCLFP